MLGATSGVGQVTAEGRYRETGFAATMGHMTSTHPESTLGQRLRRVNLPLAAVLAAVALVRPLFSITDATDALGRPGTPLVLTVLISVIWILAAGLGRVREPLLTLVTAGVLYALATIALSGVLSPILDGELQGPLAKPVSIVPLILFNAFWGAVCGLCATWLRGVRERN